MTEPQHVNGYPIECHVVRDPIGRAGVLLQMPDGFVILRPPAARQVAALLISVADEAES